MGLETGVVAFFQKMAPRAFKSNVDFKIDWIIHEIMTYLHKTLLTSERGDQFGNKLREPMKTIGVDLERYIILLDEPFVPKAKDPERLIREQQSIAYGFVPFPLDQEVELNDGPLPNPKRLLASRHLKPQLMEFMTYQLSKLGADISAVMKRFYAHDWENKIARGEKLIPKITIDGAKGKPSLEKSSVHPDVNADGTYILDIDMDPKFRKTVNPTSGIGEAEVKIVRYIDEAYKSGTKKNILIRGNDTDILVIILLNMYRWINPETDRIEMNIYFETNLKTTKNPSETESSSSSSKKSSFKKTNVTDGIDLEELDSNQDTSEFSRGYKIPKGKSSQDTYANNKKLVTDDFETETETNYEEEVDGGEEDTENGGKWKKKKVYPTYYIDMVELWSGIMSYFRLNHSRICDPIETLCFWIIMCGCDFSHGIHGIKLLTFAKFFEDKGHNFFAKKETKFDEEHKLKYPFHRQAILHYPTLKEYAFKNSFQEFRDSFHFVLLEEDQILDFIRYMFHKKLYPKDGLGQDFDGLKSYEELYEKFKKEEDSKLKKSNSNGKKSKGMMFKMNPTLESYRVNVRTALWTIIYWMNGPFRHSSLPSCTLTVNGVSVFGFVKTNKGVLFADKVIKNFARANEKASIEERDMNEFTEEIERMHVKEEIDDTYMNL
jgi:hypothetical protein